MALSKLWQLLNTLSTDEWDRFRDFLYSPYHNKSLKVRELFDLVAPAFPIPLNEAPEKTTARLEALRLERIFPLIFPDKDPKSSNLSNLMTQLKGLLDAFWAQEQFRKDKKLYVSQLLENLCYREGAEGYFDKRWKREKALCEKEAGSSHDLFLHQLGLEDLWMTHKVLTGDRGKALNVDQTLGSLLKYTLSAHLRYALVALNRSQLAGTPFDVPFLSKILQYTQAHPTLLDIPVIAIYYHLVRCFLETGELAHYESLKVAMNLHASRIAPEEASGIYSALINYLIARWRKGEDRLGEIFGWYKEADAHGALTAGGSIQVGNYLNVVNVGLALANAAKSPDQQAEIRSWVKAFTEKRYEQVKAAAREGAFQQAQAFLHYDLKAYDAAAKCLLEARNDLMTEFGRRVLLLKVYFDMGDTELFSALLNANLLFLHRKKARLSAHKFKAYNQFFRLCDKLFDLRHQPNASARKWNLLIEQVKMAEALESRQWLLARGRKRE